MDALELKKFELDVKLKMLTLDKFRGFKNSVSIQFDEKLTVLIGENGTGKTSLLDAIANTLRYIPEQILAEGYQPETLFKKTDVNNNHNQTEINLGLNLSFPFVVETNKTEDEVFIDAKGNESIKQIPVYNEETNEPIIIETWKKLDDYDLNININLATTQKKIESSKFRLIEEGIETSSEAVSGLSESLSKWMRLDDDPNYYIHLSTHLPILAYYACERFDNKGIDKKLETDIFSLYRESQLQNNSFSFEYLKNWLALQQKILWSPSKNKSSPEYILKRRTHQYIIKCIIEVLNDEDNVYDDIMIDWDEDNPDGLLLLKKGDSYISQNQLSSGEKSIISLVADIARQLAISNPKSDNPLKKGKGIVLIDEIDLHLHPKWQRKLVPKLLKLFPKVQFVITTHSPFVLANVPSQSIRIMQNKLLYEIEDLFPNFNSYGADLLKIVDVLMGLEEYIPDLLRDEFDKFFQYIDEDNLIEAEKQEKYLKTQTDPFHSEILKGQAQIELKKLFNS